MPTPRIQYHDLHPTPADLAAEVLAGLRQKPRCIPPKFFYDAEGSRLFDAITRLPEYYPTRTEMGILQTHAPEIAARVGTGALLVEPGGATPAKARLLFDGLQPCAYVPMDISRDHLWVAAEQVAAEYPWLEVHAACTDFTRLLELPPNTPPGVRVAFFPGSSIGNFNPDDAVAFLTTVAELVGPGGYLLIGVDLKKDPERLEAAYDDADGVTAAFNLNLLRRINRELGADFDLQAWRHQVRYNAEHGRVEMHLASVRPQAVQLAGERFEFDAGETIHTENSYKYHVDEFQALARRAGFWPDAVWLDPDALFSVQLLAVEGS
ncbi:methyltransferase [Thioalkalivibrio nitratireducens DSM 14787]|uniref:Methyltransferase n=1 Tax=Thioalkalivibrio nitratireducens (strain DSM 14787 / UNIQEM 213 / ALEN2) TaxID=1255043 RepID=L0E099_THIND|nr:L-histidine N(alpha)-methyltransferase [Thioalkalivibrio nitratireducens]AGA34056.1 methyltransferase [Thioalkalivibrio nitratireducens DSM 14787]